MLVARGRATAQAARGGISLGGHPRKNVVRIVTLEHTGDVVAHEQQKIKEWLEDVDRALDAAPPSHPALGRGGHRGVSVRRFGEDWG
jgi:hypothetical protein